MSTLYKIIVIIISAVVISTIGFIFYIYKNKDRIVDNIYFYFNITGIDFSKLFSLQPKVDVEIETTIANKNNLFIIFNDLYVKLYYNHLLIAESKSIDKHFHFIPINDELKFREQLSINSNIIQLLNKTEDKIIDYEVDVKIFGIKINTISGQYKF